MRFLLAWSGWRAVTDFGGQACKGYISPVVFRLCLACLDGVHMAAVSERFPPDRMMRSVSYFSVCKCVIVCHVPQAVCFVRHCGSVQCNPMCPIATVEVSPRVVGIVRP